MTYPAHMMGAGLSYWDMEAHLKRITYKPGWQLRVDPYGVGGGENVNLAITFVTEDTYNPGTQTKIGMVERVPFCMTVEQFERFVLGALERAERHECHEWFRVDGVMKYDPHKQ